MKIKYSILLWVFMALVACQREEDITIATLTYSNEAITPLYYTADISTVLNCNAPFKDVYVQYSTHVDFADYQVRQMTPGKKGSYSIALSDLEPDVTYYVRYEISNNISSLCSKEHSKFRTMALSAPVLSTVLDSTSITCNSAVVGGKIILNGGLNITERGVVYGVGEDPTIDNDLVMYEQAQDLFVCEIQGLEVVTPYYARAYAKNTLGVAYGESVRFETLSTIATMDSIAVSAITANTAKISAGVLVDGGSTITKRGVCYGESEMPSIEDSVVICEGELGKFTCEISNLNRATTYYVRAYATNSNGTVYSEEISFTTDKTIPVVTTETAKSITALSAIVGGKIKDNGGANVTECGVVYSTSQNPTTVDNKVKSEELIDEFTCELVDLQVVTTYYARAYAINEKGIAYGDEISFTTLSSSATLGKPSASSIAANTASISAEVLTDGGASITDRGVVYGTSKSPTVSNSKVTNQGGIGAYTCNLTDLNRATTYYVRAYATNSNGTVYSEEISFTTDKTIPVVSTEAAKSITALSAIVGGKIKDNGGAYVTECGVVYSTSQNPTTADNKVKSEELSDEYTCELVDLQVVTTYYARAYAVNEKGIAYGEEIRFTTLSSSATLGKPSASSITANTASISAEVLTDGGASITDRGVVYGTSKSPTVSNSKVTNQGGIGAYTCNLTDLYRATTYYVRAYATNSNGTVYSEEISFTTDAILPTLTTTEATNVFNTSAIVGGNITDDGGASITERGVVCSTLQNPTTSHNKVNNGIGSGTYTCSLTGLQVGTLYYARAYAINEKGIVYGNEVSFTTMATVNLPITTTPATDVTCTTAEVGGNITGDEGSAITERGVCYGTSPSPTMSDMTIQKGRGVGIFSCTLTDLQDGVTYYVRAYAVNTLGISYGDEISFTTKTKSVPSISIQTPQKIYSDGATIDAIITDDGCDEVIERGILYSLSSNPTENDNVIYSGSGVGTFAIEISGLKDNTTYYVRAYATNNMGVAYSDIVSFTTLSKTYHDGFEYVDLGISVKWATHNVGTINRIEHGSRFAWGETDSKTSYSWANYKHGTGAAESITKYYTNNTYGFTGDVDDKIYLEPVDDAAQANWGGDWRMPTKEEWTELRNNCTWTWTSEDGANGYRITSNINGNSIFLPGGIIYWSSSLMTHYPIAAYPFGVGSSGSIDQHNNGTRYEGKYVRAVWCETNLPDVTTTNTTLLQTSATIDGNIASDGGARVVERGVCYNTLPSPTVADMKVLAGSDIGTFSCTLSNLQEGLTYYARAYAINQAGVAYGNEITFTSLIKNEPVAVDLGLSVLWCSQNVGAWTPEDYGDYYAWGEVEPKEDYSWATYKWANGSSTTLTKYNTNSDYGVVDNITILEAVDDAATTYLGAHWRTPTYDEWKELVESCTMSWELQKGVYGVKVISNINGNSIFLPASGVRSEKDLTDQGVRGKYMSSSLSTTAPSLFHNPTISSNSYLSLSGSATRAGYGFSVRPVYSEVERDVLPTVTTTILQQVIETTAFVEGTAISDGGFYITERGIVYSTSPNPTTADRKAISGTDIGSFTCSLMDLQENTTYYARTYATNQKGTAYGGEISFITQTKIATQVSGTENGHEYIDLGLPSGLKWATCNVGASKPEEYGGYFSWGEVSEKELYSENTYSPVSSTSPLILSADAAHVHWGGNWRVPTDDELTELRENCTWIWTTQNGTTGCLIIGPNKSSIFMPAAGYMAATLSTPDPRGVGAGGNYWSSERCTDSTDRAWSIYFGSGGVSRPEKYGRRLRYYGQSIRPVCP